MPQLSVVIPAYNEERRLPTTLESVHAFLREHYQEFEVIIVDDGSGDQTNDVVDAFAKHHEGIRLITYAPNQGKGYAIRTGVMQATGDLILIDDADGSSPIAEVLHLQQAIADGADVAIGSRNKPDPDRVVVADLHRKYIGNTFNVIVQTLLLPGIYDTQCGFKLFKRNVAHDIFRVSELNGFAFDVEILYIAKLRNYKIAELAINWTNVAGSKVNVVMDSMGMFFQVLSIRRRAWMGNYKKTIPNVVTPLPLKTRPTTAAENQPEATHAHNHDGTSCSDPSHNHGTSKAPPIS
jgi:dolichyl-phosphate beta-glucosyltransferase